MHSIFSSRYCFCIYHSPQSTTIFYTTYFDSVHPHSCRTFTLPFIIVNNSVHSRCAIHPSHTMYSLNVFSVHNSLNDHVTILLLSHIRYNHVTIRITDELLFIYNNPYTVPTVHIITSIGTLYIVLYLHSALHVTIVC